MPIVLMGCVKLLRWMINAGVLVCCAGLLRWSVEDKQHAGVLVHKAGALDVSCWSHFHVLLV